MRYDCGGRSDDGGEDGEAGLHFVQSAVVSPAVLGLLEKIRPEYASMLRLVDLDDEPIGDVAAGLGLTVNNATARLHRARKALRAELLIACGTSSARACLDCSCDAPGTAP